MSYLLELLDDFGTLNLELTRETVGGLAIQSSLEAGSDHRQEVDRRVEQDLAGVSRTLAKKAVTADHILKHINVVKQQLDMNPQSSSTFAAGVPDVHPDLVSDPYAQSMELYHPDFWPGLPQQVEGLAIQGLQCWNCRSPDHLLSKCPIPRRSNFDRPPLNPRFTPRLQLVGGLRPFMAPGNFQVWYPIVTPPGFVPQTFQQNGALPSQFNNQYVPTGQARRADSYRPDNRHQPPSTSQPRVQPRPAANLTTAANGSLPKFDPRQFPSNLPSQYGLPAPQTHQSDGYHPPAQLVPADPVHPQSVARVLEIGNLDQELEGGLEPRFSQLSVGGVDDPVIDTGATHHLTGNRGWGPLVSDPNWANRNS